MALRSVAAAAFALLLASLAGQSAAKADVDVTIDKSAQRMTVKVDGEVRHVWPVSTGRSGFGTPNGRFRPQRLERSWFSRKYYNAPMPHAIFFHGGYAIHGTTELSRLGGPASHGCVRLSPSHAATLYGLVKRHGSGNTRIAVTGDSGSRMAARATMRRRARQVVEDDEDVVTRRAPVYRASSEYRAYRAPRYWDEDAYGVRWYYQGGYPRY